LKKKVRSPMEKFRIEFFVLISTTGVKFWTKLQCLDIFLDKLKLRIFYIHFCSFINLRVLKIKEIGWRNVQISANQSHKSQFWKIRSKDDKKVVWKKCGANAALMRQIIENYKIFRDKNLQNRCFQCFLTSLPTSSMDKMG
jgi:hypothetical protein